MAHETPKDPPKGTRRFYFTLTPLALFVSPVRATSCWLEPVSQILKWLALPRAREERGRLASHHGADDGGARQGACAGRLSLPGFGRAARGPRAREAARGRRAFLAANPNPRIR